MKKTTRRWVDTTPREVTDWTSKHDPRGEEMASREPEHPDLAQFGKLATQAFDEALACEHEAALMQIRRMGTLRDRLLDAEDAELTVKIWVRGGHLCEGVPSVVGQDHVELGDVHPLLIPFASIEMVELI